MSEREDIISSFDFINIKPSEDIINLSLGICRKYGVNAEDFVDQWSAYTISHLNGKEPTVEYLVAMERKEYAKKEVTSSKAVGTPKSLKVYAKAAEEMDAENVVNSYTCVTPKSNKQIKRTASPEAGPDSKRFHPTVSSQPASTPASYSPAVPTQSSNYVSRGNAQEAVLSFGNTGILHRATYKTIEEKIVEVKLCGTSDYWLSSDAMYMFEVMAKKMGSMNHGANFLAKKILEKNKLSEIEPFTQHSANTITTFGRVCCDAVGRLNSASVLLEGTRELTRGRSINMTLKNISNYSLFPGQVVTMQGSCIKGTTFVAEKLFADASPDNFGDIPTFTENMELVIASGPFSLKDNLLYQPLQDLIKYVITHKPHILILIGPFLEISHDNVADGSMTESFDTFFESLVDSIMSPLKDLHTQVIIISSSKDAHHHVVYPTPPYVLKEKYPNLHLMPDPSMLNIEGLVVGVTSADILFHLGKEEICGSQGNDRMGRFSNHILSQRSFYPLYPSDREMCIDHNLMEHFGMIDVKPHILILPSNFRYFARNINGCAVINPERISKGYVGGTFARVTVKPGATSSVFDHMACQIIRI